MPATGRFQSRPRTTRPLFSAQCSLATPGPQLAPIGSKQAAGHHPLTSNRNGSATANGAAHPEAGGHGFDLVLLDVAHPDIDGMGLLRRIRFELALTDLPVVIWSASEDQHLLSQAEQLGAVDFFVKSRFDWPQMRERLEAHLARRK